jgi:D-sedoheptulose 7-phosphate isomerase
VHKLSEYVQEILAVAVATMATDSQRNRLELEDAVSLGVELLRTARANNSKVLLVANGGSAAIASHAQNDLVKACGIRSMVFTEQPLLTALANDNGYDSAYELPTDIWADAGDVMIAISSSGNSENILRAVKVAKKHGMKVVTLSGFDEDNDLRKQGDINLYSKSSKYGIVENVHSIIAHSITDSLIHKDS